MKIWKDYIIEDAIIVVEKSMKAIKPQIINSRWRKLYPDVVHDFTGFMTKPVKEIMKEIVDTEKKKKKKKKKRKRDEEFQSMAHGEIQELTDTTPKN